MDSIFKAILEAPLPNLLTVSGLIFLGLAVLGGVSGKFQADKQGRIAAGILGSVLLLVGFYFGFGAATLPSTMRTAVTTPLDAPLPNLLIVAGLLFVGLAVVGGISGKIEPDRQGRIASGVLGGALLLAGFYALFTGAGQSQAARLEATPPPQTPVALVLSPAPVAAVPFQTPSVATPTPPPSPAARPTITSVSASAYFKEHREAALTVGADRRLTTNDTWTVRFGSVPQRQFFVSVGSLEDINDFTASESSTPYTASSSQADHTFEVQRTVAADNTKSYFIYWHFSATADQTRTFMLRYTLQGFVRDTSDGQQVLRYSFYGGGGGAVGSEHLTIKLPRSYDPSQLSAQMQANGADLAGARVVDGQTIEVSAQNLASGSLWSVQVRYPAP